VIGKRDIIDAVRAIGLAPHVVEKDHALGRRPWGIHGRDALRESWMVEGGTCPRKCLFDTCRFSKDPDVTLAGPAHIDLGFLEGVFAETGERVHEDAGIGTPPDAQRSEICRNPRGQPSRRGRIGYRGPVSPRGRNMPRVEPDPTADERAASPAAPSPVFRPCSDGPDGTETVSVRKPGVRRGKNRSGPTVVSVRATPSLRRGPIRNRASHVGVEVGCASCGREGHADMDAARNISDLGDGTTDAIGPSRKRETALATRASGRGRGVFVGAPGDPTSDVSGGGECRLRT